MKKISVFVLTMVAQFALVSLAMAQEGSAQDVHSLWAPIGAGLAMGLAALGGTLGQGKAAAAALEGIARNPGAANKVQTPMILALALTESLVLFSFVIAIMLTGKA
jgi:F-type H+-transporting ATPase subunit c